VVCLAPRAQEDSVRPRRLSGVSARPLNFTVRSHRVKTAVILGGVLIVLLDVFATRRILMSEVTSPGQKAAWLLLAWFMPLVGAMFAIQVSRESSVHAPVAGSFEGGPDPSIGLTGGGNLGAAGPTGSCGVDVGGSCGGGDS
jgi:Phospholipase_D-nuclease N-terminal